jgi:hypothetical protein
MKLLKITVGIGVGVVFAALICWGGLYAFETFMLRSYGRESSLFDARPGANAFFITWALVTLLAAIGGTRLARND